MRRSAALQEPDPVGWPVRGERLSDDPRARDGPPEATVVGEVTIVAHHEVVTGRNLEGARVVAVHDRRVAVRKAGVGLILALAVEDHVPVADRDRVPRA